MGLKKAICYAMVGHIYGTENDYVRVMAVTSMKRNRHQEPDRLYGRYTDNNATATHKTDFVMSYFTSQEAAESAVKAAMTAGVHHQLAIDNLHAHINKHAREKRMAIDRSLSIHGGYQHDWQLDA